MIHRFIIGVAAAAMCAAATAGINDFDAGGCIERARAMYADGNYVGCADQAEAACSLPMTAAQRQEALLLKAKAMVRIDRAAAATMLERFLADYPASAQRAEAMMALADCYYGPEYPQNYRKALNIYDSIDAGMLPHAEQCDLAYRQAFCLIELASGLEAGGARELYARAERHLAALAGNSKYGRAAQFYRGYIAYSRGDMAKAEALLTPLRSIGAPPCDMADFYLAQIAYAGGDWPKAMAMAKSLLQRPGIPAQYADEAMRLAGESAYRSGDDPEARKYLDMYASSAPSPQPSALYILGLYDYQAGDYARAVRMLTPATALDDAMGQSAYLYIGQALSKEGDYDGAALALQRAMGMTFDPAAQEAAHYNYAVASLRGGKVPFGNAVSAFEDFMRAYPDSRYAPEAQRYVIDSYFGSGDYAGALRSIGAMARPTAETRRAELMALYRLGAQAIERGRGAEASEWLGKAKGLARYDAETAREATLLLGEAQYLEGEYARAANSAREYLNSAPRGAANRAVAEFDLGYALFAQKKYAHASTSFDRAADSDALPAPIRADAACRLGDCLYYAKDFDAASGAYDRAYSLNPAVGDYALLRKAMMEGYKRNHRAKIAYIEQLQREFPKSACIPDALLEMTESYIQLGDNSSAIATYRKLVDKYPGTSQGRQGHLQMALTMLNSGDRRGAISAFKDVVRLYPTSDEAAQGAEALKRIAADEGWLGEYADFINSVPGAPKFDATEAEALEFEAAEKAYIADGNASKLDAYVDRYPRGAHRAKALSYLLQHAVKAADDDAAYARASALAADYPDNGLALEAFVAKALIDQKRGKLTLALASWQALGQRASTPYYLDMARMGIARNALALAEHELAGQSAAEAIESATLSATEQAEARYILGASLNARGLTDQARQAWMPGADDTDDPYGAQCAYQLAQLSYDTGALDRAEDEAKALANSNSEQAYWVARAFILLSDIYAAQGNEYKAQQYLKSLRDNYPGTEADIFEMIGARLK